MAAKKKAKKKIEKKAKRKPAARSKLKNITNKTTLQQNSSSRAEVYVGQKMPDFKLPATGEQTVVLSDLRGRTVVLYFYPKDSTPGCTLEGREFSALLPQFRAAKAEVFGVSRDSMKSHENFKAKQNYTVDLISDAEEKLCLILGVIKMKNMYGRQVRGIERSTFVIGPDGKLIKEWRGVKVPGHAQEVLNFVKERS